MRSVRILVATATLLFAVSCSDRSTVAAPPGEGASVEANVNPDTGLPINSSKQRLPASVKIVSDTQPNFGINLSQLAPEHAAIVNSAWETYNAILSGREPKCSAAYGASDGGTITYFCDGYDVTRAHGLASQGGVDGFEYGPMLDLLNGQRVERVRFYSQEDLAALKRTAPNNP